MGATSFLGAATEWEQPLFVCGVYQVDIAQRAGGTRSQNLIYRTHHIHFTNYPTSRILDK